MEREMLQMFELDLSKSSSGEAGSMKHERKMA